nr:MAG TPA: hypothetical protein [Caudoviricetes sp.]DAS61543.1 MAG TPA: hypothetical protein [Caudoviricetes sp.]DAW46186.1 MAG TPA: hypothetical protein [Bacteriophage sp.]
MPCTITFFINEFVFSLSVFYTTLFSRIKGYTFNQKRPKMILSYPSPYFQHALFTWQEIRDLQLLQLFF